MDRDLDTIRSVVENLQSKVVDLEKIHVAAEVLADAVEDFIYCEPAEGVDEIMVLKDAWQHYVSTVGDPDPKS